MLVRRGITSHRCSPLVVAEQGLLHVAVDGRLDAVHCEIGEPGPPSDGGGHPGSRRGSCQLSSQLAAPALPQAPALTTQESGQSLIENNAVNFGP